MPGQPGKALSTLRLVTADNCNSMLFGRLIVENSMILCVFQWLPESARYHVASGQPEKALSTLRLVAADNGKPMLFGRLVVEDSIIGERGRVGDLLISQLRRTSLLLWFIW